LKTHLEAMARYNRWMNERLYECSAHLSDAQRKEDVGAFFKSIHGTLNHLLLAEELYAGFAELRAQRAVTDAAIGACARFSAPLTCPYGRSGRHSCAGRPLPALPPFALTGRSHPRAEVWNSAAAC
jgi:hypothetical protein